MVFGKNTPTISQQNERETEREDDVIEVVDEDENQTQQVKKKPTPTDQKDQKKPLQEEVTYDGSGSNKAGGSRPWVCKHCIGKFTSSYTRIHYHFFGDRRCETLLRDREKHEKLWRKVQDAEHIGVSKTLKNSVLSKNASSKKRIEESFAIMKRNAVDMKIVRGLCANGIPFNVLRNPQFVEMVNAIKRAPDGYKPPSYEKARTVLLDECVRDVEKDLTSVKDTWYTQGVSIVSDGWSNVKHQPLINVLAVNSRGAMFMYAEDFSGVEKTGVEISKLLLGAIETIGPSNVLQVVTDNAANCKAAGREIEKDVMKDNEYASYYSQVEKIVLARWEKMTIPLHCLGFALNPRFYDKNYLSKMAPSGIPRKAPNQDVEVVSGVMATFDKVSENEEEGRVLRDQFARFHMKKGIYSMAATQADAVTMDPIDWWSTYGSETPELAEVAKKVLSQPISSSSAERNWSTYSYIHNVKRNRLNSKRADKLVFIHSNIRLQSRFSDSYKAGPHKNWDIDPESTYIEGSSSRLQEMAWENLDEEDMEDGNGKRQRIEEHTFSKVKEFGAIWEGRHEFVRRKYDFEGSHRPGEENPGVAYQLGEVFLKIRKSKGKGWGRGGLLKKRLHLQEKKIKGQTEFAGKGGVDSMVSSRMESHRGSSTKKMVGGGPDGDEIELADVNVEVGGTVYDAKEILLDCEALGQKLSDRKPPSIYRVPRSLRDLSPHSFKPRVVSIGPLHREDKTLQEFECQKAIYLHHLLKPFVDQRNDILDKFLEKVNTSIPEIRECYGETIPCTDAELAKMMVMDACFIIEFLFPSGEPKPLISGNLILENSISKDLVLLENQIPFFVLQDIFDTLFVFPSGLSLTSAILKHLEYLNPLKVKTNNVVTPPHHVLGLLQNSIHSAAIDVKDYCPLAPLRKHSALELDKAGVKFKPNESGNWSLAIDFSSSWFESFCWCCTNRTLSMPAMWIYDSSETFLRNIIAYEQCTPNVPNYVTSYTRAIDYLVDTTEDLSRLIKSKIVTNNLGSIEEATNMINNIGKEVVVSEFYYLAQWNQLDDYYNGFWPKNIARLKRTYFSSPWNAIALFAGIILFALTLIQTIYAVKAK
ncbi:hypothetical protein OSB04_021308 [Centaurea solstitialis]|uniref:DUF659 domain-containing protein n=1 Tax=Centaurea solstitialis TaxID=347529 RepID=A0AA38WE33_9ASTR|nr:hypothetical protein OSB04_021308 [Centaurea solstitialis]